MIDQIDQFRELIISGKKGGRFYLPTATGRLLQLYFTKSPSLKSYILQAYLGHDWLWTSYDDDRKWLVRDFDEIIGQYTDF